MRHPAQLPNILAESNSNKWMLAFVLVKQSDSFISISIDCVKRFDSLISILLYYIVLLCLNFEQVKFWALIKLMTTLLLQKQPPEVFSYCNFLRQIFEINYLRGKYNKRSVAVLMLFFILCIVIWGSEKFYKKLLWRSYFFKMQL